MANDYERWKHYSKLELVEEIERLEAAAEVAADQIRDAEERLAADGRTPDEHRRVPIGDCAAGDEDDELCACGGEWPCHGDPNVLTDRDGE